MNDADDKDQRRYLFTVRQRFGEPPKVDSFYELTVPAGITGDQAEVMTKLNKDWCSNEIRKDTEALKGMKLRLRFNSDMYENVCLVHCNFEITSEDLDSIIAMKNVEGKLIEFLEESSV